MAKMNKKLITLLHTLPSMGMAFIVLGVLLMVAFVPSCCRMATLSITEKEKAGMPSRLGRD